MATSYENILRNVESLSRAEQLRLISEVAEHLRMQHGPEVTSILELQGLGKEIWAGIDAQEYWIANAPHGIAKRIPWEDRRP